MVFCGYTLILLIDKVMFDTTALFTKPEAEGDEQTFADPVENNLRRSISNSLVGSRVEDGTRNKSVDEEIEKNVKEYLNKSDRFA